MTRVRYPRVYEPKPRTGWSVYARPRRRSAAVPTSSAALLWPWLTASPPHAGGQVIGLLQSGAAFAYDPHTWYEVGYINSMNGVVLGKMGSGKSTTSCAMSLRSLAPGDRKIVVVDGKTDWSRYADAYNGTVVRFDRNTAVNLLEVPAGTDPHDAAPVRFRAARALVALAAERDLDSREVWALERAVHELEGDEPLLEDLLRIVRRDVSDAAQTPDAKMLADAGASLIAPLSRLTSERGGFGRLLNRHSTVKFDRSASLFVVSLGDLTLAEDLRTAALIAVAGWIDAAVVGNKERRLLVLDEAWQLLKQPQAAIAHAERLKLARANHLATLLILHRPSDVESYGQPGSPHRAAVESVMGLSDIHVVGRLDHKDAGKVADLINLNGEERRLIENNPQGRFLWSVATADTGRRSWVVQTQRTPWEAAMWNTKAVPQ